MAVYPFDAGGGLEAIRDGSAIPASNYPPPVGAIFMSPSGSDLAAGTQANPVKTINRAVELVPAAGTIVMRGGTYRDWLHNGAGTATGTLTKACTIQAYPGEQPWFDGSDVVGGWEEWEEPGTGLTFWRVSWETPSFAQGGYYTDPPDAQPSVGFQICRPEVINPAFPMAGDPQMVFVDGVQLTQVQNYEDLDATSFKYDWDNRFMVLGGDPTGSTVELAARPACILAGYAGLGGGALAFNVKGIGFRRFATNQASNRTRTAVYVGTYPALIEGCTFVENATTALQSVAPYNPLATASFVVRGCVFARNGGAGILGSGSNNATVENGPLPDNAVIEDCWFYQNNRERFGVAGAFSAEAAVKVVLMRNLRVTRCMFEEAFSPGDDLSGRGLWCDLNCTNATITHNVFRNNEGLGTLYEVSGPAVVAFNVAHGNADKGIQIASGEVFCWNNVSAYNAGFAFDISEDLRAPGTAVAGNTENLSFCNNVGVSDNDEIPMSIRCPTNSPVAWEEPFSSPPEFFSEFGANVWWRDGAQDLVRWFDQLEPPGTPIGYESAAGFAAARGLDHDALDLVDPDALPIVASDDFRISEIGSRHKMGRPIPYQVASVIGQRPGCLVGVGARGVPILAPPQVSVRPWPRVRSSDPRPWPRREIPGVS